MWKLGLFCALTVLFALSAAQSLEGAYDVPDFPGHSAQKAYVCYENGTYFGNLNLLTAFKARPVNDGTSLAAHGRFWGAGSKFGGPRMSANNWQRSTGHIYVYEDGDNVIFSIRYRNTVQWLNYSATKTASEVNSTDISRELKCFMFDPSSTTPIQGDYQYFDGHQNVSVCQSDREVTMSWYEEDVGALSYSKGHCYQNGQICAFDTTGINAPGADTRFWTEMFIRLTNGTLLNLFSQGPSYYTPQASGFQTMELLDSVPSSCDGSASRAYNPLKCQQFTNEECEMVEDFGLCEIDSTKQNANGNSCFKVPYEAN